MLELKNRTSYVAQLVPYQDVHGFEHLAVVVKGTFRIDGGEPEVAAEQVALAAGDVFHGVPGKSSIRWENDLGQPKLGADVVLVGHAHAPRGQNVRSVDVELRVGPVGKTVRVIGDRAWYKALGSWKPTEPAPFNRMPLVWERAFGGADQSVGAAGQHPWEQRNDLGTGFVADGSRAEIDGLRLPNLEIPRA